MDLTIASSPQKRTNLSPLHAERRYQYRPTPTYSSNPHMSTKAQQIDTNQPFYSDHYVRHYSRIYTLRRILFTAGLLPVLSCLLPPILFLTTLFLSTLSSSSRKLNEGVFVVATTIAIVNYIYYKIKKYAPSHEKYKEAMKQCTAGYQRLYFLVLAAVIVTLRFVVHPILSGLFSMVGASSQKEENKSSVVADFWKVTGLGVRVSFGMTILSFAVVLRFVGVFSIAQCSTIPLPSNPIDSFIKNTLYTFASFDSFLDRLTGIDTTSQPTPRNKSSTFLNGSSEHLKCKRFRFKRPTIIQCSIQITLNAIGGAAFCYGTLLPFLLPFASQNNAHSVSVAVQQQQSYTAILLSITTTLTSITTLLITYLNDGISHEIVYRQKVDYDWNCDPGDKSSPKVECKDEAGTALSLNAVQLISKQLLHEVQRRGLIPYWVCIPLISLAGAWMTLSRSNDAGGSSYYSNRLSNSILPIFHAYLVTILVSVYLLGTDIMIRRALTTKGINVDRLVYEYPASLPPTLLESATVPAAQDKTKSFCQENATFLPEDLIVHSVLAGFGYEVLRNVIASRAKTNSAQVNGLRVQSDGISDVPIFSGFGNSNTNDLEEEEVQRNDAIIDIVADAMLSPSSGVCSFEEDLLRVALLESLGGGGSDNGSTGDVDLVSKCCTNFRLSPRHLWALHSRLMVSDASTAGQPWKQSVLVPVVRALCAYAGGLGEALLRCSDNVSQMRQEQQLMSPAWRKEGKTWSLAPCATAAAEYAVLGAARLIALHATQPMSNGARRNRYNRISVLVPVLLHSVHRLRFGVLLYAQYLLSEMDEGGSLSQHRSQIESVGGDRKRFDKIINFIAIRFPDLRHILLACDDAAIMIMRTLTAIDGPRDAELRTHAICREWLEGLQSK